MITSDIFEETYIAISSNKARSSLTMLGVVIGISSVIAMVAIGQGSQSSIESSIESIGSNLVQIMPGVQQSTGSRISAGQGSARTLTQADADAIATEIYLASSVAPELSGRYQVSAKGGNNTNTSVVGITETYPAVRNVVLAEGTPIASQHLASLSKVAVLGFAVSEDLFGEDVSPIGKTIKIKNTSFKVIGINEEKGSSGMGGSQDDMIFIPLTTAQKFLAGSEYVTTVSVQAVDADSIADMQQAITDLLLVRHNIADEDSADFRIMNLADVVETASSVTETFTLLLGAVAGISLLVGGIGIMNMMLTTVTERTREIGLRKAIGAKKWDISLQFLAESVALTFIGGLVGIVLGWLIAFLISELGGVQTTVSWGSILLAFSVSAGIGIAFGYYPARRAASLNPITALRYE
ncbi:MAG: ABC transporter permease [Patescibacteria group bacterium]